MEFTKAHGTANDFVVLTDLDDRLHLGAGLVRALADRRRGIGADGVIRIGDGGADADVFMDYRNADGSVVEMCGNGVRVVAKLAVDHGLVTPGADGTVRVGTRAGVKPVTVRRGADGRVVEVTVDMGPPRTDADAIPVAGLDADPVTGLGALAVAGRQVTLAAVSMGNPHAVLPTADVATAAVADLGPAIERHPSFPAGANVGFAEVVDPSRLRLRVWERGVGETAACGTGACAAVVAMQRTGALGSEVVVEVPGGRLTVRHDLGGTVLLTGPAVEVARGRIDPGWLAALPDDGPVPR